MKENEIIKALECCIRNEYCCTCEECPLDTYPQCEEVLYRETVDLINRQKTEIKQKDTEIDILIRKKEALRDEIAEQQAEIERLQQILEKRCDKCPAVNTAYKKFADRLKLQFIADSLQEVINQVLTELTERKEDEGK